MKGGCWLAQRPRRRGLRRRLRLFERRVVGGGGAALRRRGGLRPLRGRRGHLRQHGGETNGGRWWRLEGCFRYMFVRKCYGDFGDGIVFDDFCGDFWRGELAQAVWWFLFLLSRRLDSKSKRKMLGSAWSISGLKGSVPAVVFWCFDVTWVC